jgi:hypothetical protein
MYRGAQFQCDELVIVNETPTAVGTFRVATAVSVDLLFPSDVELDDDHLPPELLRIDAVSGTELDQNGDRDVTVTIEANDESGVREYIVQVYRDNGDGTGYLETYSSMDDPSDVPPLIGPRTFNVKAAPGELLGYYVVDQAGNALSRKARGRLYEPLYVELILEIAISGSPSTEVLVIVEDNPLLVEPQLFIDIGNGLITEVIDAQEALDSGILKCGVPELGKCQFTLSYSLDGVGGSTIPITATLIDAEGRNGTATEFIQRACDEVGELVDGLENGDIHLCPVTPMGDSVAFDLILAPGSLVTDQFQYRLFINDLQFKLNDLDKVTTPIGVTLTAPVYDPTVPNRVRFKFAPGDVAWDGVSPLPIRWETRAGVAGLPETGLIDEGFITAP